MGYDDTYESSYASSVESSPEAFDLAPETSDEAIEADADFIDADFDFDAENAKAEVSEGDSKANTEAIDKDFDFDAEDARNDVPSEISEENTEAIDGSFDFDIEDTASSRNAENIAAEESTEQSPEAFEDNTEIPTDEPQAENPAVDKETTESIEDLFEDTPEEFEEIPDGNPEDLIEDVSLPEDAPEMDSASAGETPLESIDSAESKAVEGENIDEANPEGTATDQIDKENSTEQSGNGIEHPAKRHKPANAEAGAQEYGKDDRFAERTSFIGTNGNPDRVIAMGISADAAAEMHRSEMLKAEEAKAPEMHRGETVVETHDDRSGAVITSGEELLHQEAFRAINADSKPEKALAAPIDEIGEESHSPILEGENEKKEPDEETNQQFSIALQAMQDQSVAALDSDSVSLGTMNGSIAGSIPPSGSNVPNDPTPSGSPPPPSASRIGFNEVGNSSESISESGNERRKNIERTEEEFRRSLEEYRGLERAAYENQKQFEALESDLREHMDSLLSDYTGHGIEHVQEVIEEGSRILDALEASGMAIPEETKRAYSLAAKYHDIGMAESQGLNAAREIQEKRVNFDGDFKAFAQYFNLDQHLTGKDGSNQWYNEIMASAGDDGIRKKEIKNRARMQLRMQAAKELAAQIRRTPPSDPERAKAISAYNVRLADMQSAVFNSLRANHAEKSAEYILQYGETNEFKERYGTNLNPRNIACAIMLHSKTNSGCGDLDLLTKNQCECGKRSVEEVSSRLIADWNQRHEDMRVDGTLSQDDLKEIAFLASVLRIADNRRNGETASFTGGDSVICEASGDDVRVFHSKEVDGKTIRERELVSQESVRIISSESCTRFGELLPEGKNLVHTIDFNGKGSGKLEKAFVCARIVDYICEVESGVLKSGRTASEASARPHGFSGDNILEIRVDAKSRSELYRMQIDWQRWLTEGEGLKPGKREIAMEYGKPGRIRLVSKESKA